MRKDLAAEIGYNIATDIVTNLISDVEELMIAEAVFSQLSGLEDSQEVEAEVRKHLDIIKNQINMRF